MTLRNRIGRYALIAAILVAIYLLVAILGPHAGLFDPYFAFATLTFSVGFWLVAGVGVLAVIGLLAALLKAPRKGWVAALIALLLPLAYFGGAANLRSTAGELPLLHDISTDTANPPQFTEALLNAREDDNAQNPIRGFDFKLAQTEPWSGTGSFDANPDQTPADLIAEGYPDVQPLVVSGAVSASDVAQAMRDFGLDNVRITGDVVEGTAVTLPFAFKDDVVARLTPGETGTTIDFRSTSRVGLSDIGYNAARIMELRAAVEAQPGK